MGAATGDFDNDGWIDLYVTNLGSNQLFRNNGDGTFTDVTARSADATIRRWSTSATFFDYDRDGWLDLFVANYVDFSVDMKRGCFSAGSARDYCNPVVYAPVPDRLFHNDGDGTFTDVSARAGISRAPARGLGVLGCRLQRRRLDRSVRRQRRRPEPAVDQPARIRHVQGRRPAGGRRGEPRWASRRGAWASTSVTSTMTATRICSSRISTTRATRCTSIAGKGLFEDRTTESGLFKLGFTGFGTRFVDLRQRRLARPVRRQWRGQASEPAGCRLAIRIRSSSEARFRNDRNGSSPT